MKLPDFISQKRLVLLYCIIMISATGIVAQQHVGIGTTTPVATLNLIGAGANVTIPGSTSSGIFRIGVNAIEGIDFGKMAEPPFSGWMQSGYNGNIADPLSLQPMGGSVGIGTTQPHYNAVLDLHGINKGLLIPRGGENSRANLNGNNAKGLIMYDTITSTLWIHNGNGLASGWQNVANGANHWTLSGALGTEIANTNSGGIWSSNESTVLGDPGPTLPPTSGAGTRMMWLPQKSAFRVGTAEGAQWDASNIGVWSFATGISTIASGQTSTALGNSTKASAISSTALGQFTLASGVASLATGSFSTASGPSSTALGVQNAARSHYSTALGNNNIAKGFSSTVIGMYNDSLLTTNEPFVSPTTPLFVIGNGNGPAAGQRSNAMVVRKDGNVGIGTVTPSAKLHISGTVKIVDGTQGTGKVLTSDDTGLASWQSPPPPPPPPAYINSVSICCQSWMTKNLDVSTYRNGDAIPKVTSNAAWTALTTGAYCYFNNDSATYAATYGKIYNWYAVNDARGLAPEGWHIPTAFEWTTLSECLGGPTVAGGPLKEAGTVHWASPNTGATNLSGYIGLPGGQRVSGVFINLGLSNLWWSSTEYSATESWFLGLGNTTASVVIDQIIKTSGVYVRCIRD